MGRDRGCRRGAPAGGRADRGPGRRARRVVPGPDRALQVSPTRRLRRGAAPARQRQALQASAAGAATSPRDLMGICDGRVVIVTGSGRGIGREHALGFAREGAKVVVNDLGGDMHGEGGSLSPAMEVVEEIKAMGGEAVADGENVADFAGAGRLVQRAVDTFGHLDTLVNNAGILRDRMLVNMEESEWDAVIAVHLKGAFGPTRHAAAYWRDQAKAGTPVQARVVNTSSPSGIFGNAGQTNYGAAKAGIAAFTIICGLELGRYGVCTNAIAPVARTRMTENLGFGAAAEGSFHVLDPAQ